MRFQPNFDALNGVGSVAEIFTAALTRIGGAGEDVGEQRTYSRRKFLRLDWVSEASPVAEDRTISGSKVPKQDLRSDSIKNQGDSELDTSSDSEIAPSLLTTTLHLLQLGWLLLITLLPLVIFVGFAAAAPNETATSNGAGLGSDFCRTKLAQTIKNVFILIQYGGPLLGGTLALGATVVIPYTRRSDVIQELKTVRNQAVVWGVLVAPLGTEIVGFLLTNVVAGGASCGF